MRNALWTAEDVKNGDCSPLDLGELKPLSTMNEVLSAENNAPPTEGDNTQLELTSALQAAYVKMGSEKSFVAWAQKNPNLVYPMIAKLGIAQVAKTVAPPLKTLDDYSDDEIEAMSSNDLKRLLLEAAKKCPHCGEKLEV